MTGGRQTNNNKTASWGMGQILLCFLGSLPSLNFPPLGHPAEITGNYFQDALWGEEKLMNSSIFLPGGQRMKCC